MRTPKFCDCGTFEGGAYNDAPLLANAACDPKTGACTLFALHRGAEATTLEAQLRSLGVRKVASASQLHHLYLKTINSKQQPDAVTPSANETAVLKGETLRATLQPYSWNVFALT